MNRVAVFIDAQNVYPGARRCFFAGQGPSRAGQIAPLALGQLLCDQRNPHQPSAAMRTLDQVRIYTGRPDSALDPRPTRRTGVSARRGNAPERS